MTLFLWSQTAATNDDVDATINFQEGQSPGSVNNSCRALMAAVAKFRDDKSGNLVTAGSSTVYTLTSNQTFTALTDGISVVCRMDETSGAAPTLNVDSLGAKSIATVYGTAIPTGALLAGGVYGFTYDSTDDKWIVNGRFGDTMLSGDNPDLVAIEAIAGTTGALRKTAANTWSLDSGTTNIVFVFDNNGTALTTGVKGDLSIPYAATITGVTLLADTSGSIVIDIWKDTYASYPPTDADSITAAAPPTISSATKSVDTTLTGWTTSITAGDILRFNIDSCTSITRCSLLLKINRFI
jgi:hypothetical protein